MTRTFGPAATLLLIVMSWAGQTKAQPTAAAEAVSGEDGAAALSPSSRALRLVEAARSRVGVTMLYDPSYVGLAYPGGDVPNDRGVCTDVVVRAFRLAYQIDLQKEVHEDMRAHFIKYPQNWGLKRPDRNIDHRRVPNLNRFFERRGTSLPITNEASDYQAGDIVSWRLPTGQLHIGIVSDRKTEAGVPLVIHNIGTGTQEEDLLFQLPIVAHFRWSRHEPGEVSKR